MITRRMFLKVLCASISSLFASWFIPRSLLALPSAQNSSSVPFVTVVSGLDKKAILEKALQLSGGLSSWVKSGMHVVIKPNAAWARTPEQAANVHPELLKALIEACYKEGAGTVTVVENTCDTPEIALKVNGIKDAVASTKAKLVSVWRDNSFVKVEIPHGKKLKSVEVPKVLREADLFINMPIAKTHGSAMLTLSMKNHMGAIQNRWYFHMNDLHQCIAEVSTVLKPHLVVMDATRLMITNGPKGPGEVREENKVIVGTDQVAIDAYAATLFGYTGADIGYIKKAYELGVGEIDLTKVDIRTATV